MNPYEPPQAKPTEPVDSELESSPALSAVRKLFLAFVLVWVFFPAHAIGSLTETVFAESLLVFGVWIALTAIDSIFNRKQVRL